MRLDSIPDEWPGTAYQQANSEISNRITQGAGINVGVSLYTPVSGRCQRSVLVIGGHSSGTSVISRDGKLIAYTYYGDQLKDPWRVGVMELYGNSLLQSFPQPFRCFRWPFGEQLSQLLSRWYCLSPLYKDDARAEF